MQYLGTASKMREWSQFVFQGKPLNERTLTGGTDAEAETPVFWSSDANSWHIGKVPDAGKDWGQKEKRASEDEMADGITEAMHMNLGKLWEMVRDREAWHAAVHGITELDMIGWLNNIKMS